VRYVISIVLASTVALGCSEVGQAAPSAKVAALQIGLRANGLYGGAIDGVSGPLTRGAVLRLQRTSGIRPTGRVGHATRCELGKLGKPLLGQRSLTRGRVGWDVSVLEFRLRKYGLARRRIDGRFDAATTRALRRFQRAHRLGADGIAGARTFRALTRGRPAKVRIAAKPRQARRTAPRTGPAFTHVVLAGEGFYSIGGRYRVDATAIARLNGLTLRSVIAPGQRLRIPGRGRVERTISKPVVRREARLTHRVAAGESFFSISQRYHVSPKRVAMANDLSLMATIVPGQRLTLPQGAYAGPSGQDVDRDVIRAALDRWSATYGVDAKLTRAVAWMESGFQQDVVSSAGAIGVMQLLPETWQFVDEVLLGEVTPRTYDGNIRAGVRLLRWQLDNFDGNVRLALAAYYQGARAVRERGLFDDTKQYVSVILQLYGTV
jgi:N-acetylmuramoyl-L-alanine amidase